MALRSAGDSVALLASRARLRKGLQLVLQLREGVVFDVDAALRALAVRRVLLALREHLIVAAHQARTDRILRCRRERKPRRYPVLRGRDARLGADSNAVKNCVCSMFCVTRMTARCSTGL